MGADGGMAAGTGVEVAGPDAARPAIRADGGATSARGWPPLDGAIGAAPMEMGDEAPAVAAAV